VRPPGSGGHVGPRDRGAGDRLAVRVAQRDVAAREPLERGAVVGEPRGPRVVDLDGAGRIVEADLEEPRGLAERTAQRGRVGLVRGLGAADGDQVGPALVLPEQVDVQVARDAVVRRQRQQLEEQLGRELGVAVSERGARGVEEGGRAAAGIPLGARETDEQVAALRVPVEPAERRLEAVGERPVRGIGGRHAGERTSLELDHEVGQLV